MVEIDIVQPPILSSDSITTTSRQRQNDLDKLLIINLHLPIIIDGATLMYFQIQSMVATPRSIHHRPGPQSDVRQQLLVSIDVTIILISTLQSHSKGIKLRQTVTFYSPTQLKLIDNYQKRDVLVYCPPVCHRH